jgi:enamine deaminase RidA (YjgF/YER057c/UK114 family)
MGKQIIGGGNAEGLPISEAVRAGDFIFLSGLVGFGTDGQIVAGGVAAETHAIFAEVTRLLALGGATLDDVVKVNVYLADAGEFREFNTAYGLHLTRAPPARISMSVCLTIDARVELDLIAYIGDRGKPHDLPAGAAVQVSTA